MLLLYGHFVSDVFQIKGVLFSVLSYSSSLDFMHCKNLLGTLLFVWPSAVILTRLLYINPVHVLLAVHVLHFFIHCRMKGR